MFISNLYQINFYIYFILVFYYFSTNFMGVRIYIDNFSGGSSLLRMTASLFITFGAISLYSSGNIDLATSLYLIVHRMAAELPIKHSTYTLLLLFVVVVVYRAAVRLVINKESS